MEMHTDSFFTIGQKHTLGGMPCQDYALARDWSDERSEFKFAFATVSDGCSSGGNTDVGARLVALATLQAIQAYWDETKLLMPWMRLWVNKHRTETLKNIALGLTVEDLLATSLSAFLFSNAGILYGLVSVQGDGVVAVKYVDGSMALHRFDWPNNMPFYPAYEGWRLEEFVKAHGGDPVAKVLAEECWRMDAQGNFVRGEDIMHSVKDGIEGIKKPVQSFLSTDEIEYVAVFSDGVTQIDGVDWKDATRMFMGFKSTAGAFAKRRMIAGIRETMQAGKGPLDDIAYAVIRASNTTEKGGLS